MDFPTRNECENAIYKSKRNILIDYKKVVSNNRLDDILHSQQQLLKNCILSNGKQDFFNVFDMKCSTGKTYVAVNSMPYYLYNVSQGYIDKKGVLFVIRQTEEIDKYVNDLNLLFKDEDTGHYKEVAIAYHYKKYTSKDGIVNEDERNKLIGKLGFYPILFITHENYIQLAENKKLRKTFARDRRLLIIDESIDICEIVKVSNLKEKEENTICLDDFENIEKKLKDEDVLLFKNILNPLLNKFNNIKKEKGLIKNKVYNFKMKHKQYNKQIDYLSKEITDKSIKKILKIIKLIYNDTCIINKALKEDDEKGRERISIKTINRNKKMWALSNNIILDASALLEMKYTLNKKLYFLMNCQNTLDYSNWHIEYIFASSTKTAKKIGYKRKSPKDIQKYKKYLNACSVVIKDLGIDDVLVVCSKEEHITINETTGQEILFNPFSVNIPLKNIAHFGNITGKREYENLQNILIAHTPNYEDTDYILQYMYYADKRYSDNETFESASNSGLGYIQIFKNQELQEFKEKTIANQIYQAVCRVNRNMEYETTVIIISKYLGSILYVRDMLSCQCYRNTNYDSYFEVGKNEVNEDRESKGKTTKLLNFFSEVLKGNIANYKIEYELINSNIVKVKKEDIKKCLEFNDTQFNKAKSNNDKFITDNSIICCRNYYYFILDEVIKTATNF